MAVNIIKSSGDDDNDSGDDEDDDGGEDKDILFSLNCLEGRLINSEISWVFLFFLSDLAFLFFFSSLVTARHMTGLELFDIIERMFPT